MNWLLYLWDKTLIFVGQHLDKVENSVKTNSKGSNMIICTTGPTYIMIKGKNRLFQLYNVMVGAYSHLEPFDIVKRWRDINAI